MICKGCGNVISKGTYCLRCGTENNENAGNEQLDDIQRDYESSNKQKSTLKSIFKVIIVWIIILIVLGIIQSIMESSYNHCVDVKGHDECGLGALCDHECMPPFYITVTLFSAGLHILAILVIPALLLLGIIIDKVKERKK